MIPLTPAVLAKKLTTAWVLLMQNPHALRKLVKLEPYVVFSAPTSEIPVRPVLKGVTVRMMTRAEIEALAPLNQDVRDGLNRLRALADSAAYGAFCDGTFAHMSWIVTGDRDRERLPPRLARLRRDEAEITHCVTLPEFRGRQIYPFVISHLFEWARAQGIREIFMVTKHDNIPSQQGILKAGLTRRRGRIYCLRLLHVYPVFRTFRFMR